MDDAGGLPYDFSWAVGPIYVGEGAGRMARLAWVRDFWDAEMVIEDEHDLASVFFLHGRTRWERRVLQSEAKGMPRWVRLVLQRTGGVMDVFLLLTDVVEAGPGGSLPCAGVTRHRAGKTEVCRQVLVLPRAVFYADGDSSAEWVVEPRRRTDELQSIYPGLRVDDALLSKWPSAPRIEAGTVLRGDGVSVRLYRAEAEKK